MTEPSDPVVVAVINTSPDTVELLSHALEHAGFLVVSGFTYDIRSGKLDFTAFLRQHQPRVIVYDVAPPYDRNYRLLEHVRGLEGASARPFVLTSTNAAHVAQLSGHNERVFEVIEKPIDLNLIVDAVRQAAKSRPTK